MTIAWNTASRAARRQHSSPKLKKRCQGAFLPAFDELIFARRWPSPCEVMNGWLMWHGYGANQFLVTRLVALTQKVRRVGVRITRVRGRPGTLREVHLYCGAIYIFNFYCFYWLYKRGWWVTSWCTFNCFFLFLPLPLDQSPIYCYPPNPRCIYPLLHLQGGKKWQHFA